MSMLLATLGVWALAFFSWFVHFFFGRNPDPVVRFLGRVYSIVSIQQRLALKENLHFMLNLQSKELQSMTTRIFENFCLTLYDFFHPQDVLLDVPEREKVERCMKEKKGVLILTFHIGHWELGARVMQQWGWPVSAVYQEYRNTAMKKLIQRLRAPGVNYIPVGVRAANRVLEAFRRGDVVAMLGDHPFGEEGVPVQLFGRFVRWPKGPIVLAVKERVPIVAAAIVRVAPNTYRAFVEDPLIPQNHSRAEVHRLVQEVAFKFAKFARAYPEQWYRFRRFEKVEVAKYQALNVIEK